MRVMEQRLTTKEIPLGPPLRKGEGWGTIPNGEGVFSKRPTSSDVTSPTNSSLPDLPRTARGAFSCFLSPVSGLLPHYSNLASFQFPNPSLPLAPLHPPSAAPPPSVSHLLTSAFWLLPSTFYLQPDPLYRRQIQVNLPIAAVRLSLVDPHVGFGAGDLDAFSDGVHGLFPAGVVDI